MIDAAVSADGRTRENEADRFAATVLRQAYISSRVTTNRDVLAEFVQAGVAEQLNPDNSWWLPPCTRLRARDSDRSCWLLQRWDSPAGWDGRELVALSPALQPARDSA